MKLFSSISSLSILARWRTFLSLPEPLGDGRIASIRPTPSAAGPGLPFIPAVATRSVHEPLAIVARDTSVCVCIVCGLQIPLSCGPPARNDAQRPLSSRPFMSLSRFAFVQYRDPVEVWRLAVNAVVSSRGISLRLIRAWLRTNSLPVWLDDAEISCTQRCEFICKIRVIGQKLATEAAMSLLSQTLLPFWSPTELIIDVGAANAYARVPFVTHLGSWTQYTTTVSKTYCHLYTTIRTTCCCLHSAQSMQKWH